MIDSVIPVILLLLYLLFVFILNYYKNLKVEKIKNKVDLNKNKIINLYCYNENNINKLFWLTLLDLINEKYYELYQIDNITYIKWNKKNLLKIDELKVNKYESSVIMYINTLISKNSNDLSISLELLDNKVSSDWNFQSVKSNYAKALKEESINECGIVDKISIYIIPAIITYLYFLQVLYFFSSYLKVYEMFLFSVPLTLISLIITYFFRKKIKKYDIKKYLLAILISVFLAFIATDIWQKFYNNDYIIFHVFLALIVFMYQIQVINTLYYLNTSFNYKNKKQKDLALSLNNLCNNMITEIEDKDLVYALCFDFKVNTSNEIKDYIKRFKL